MNAEAAAEDGAFAARCLLRATRYGTLATQGEAGPFASLVTHAVTPEGAVLLLLSSLAAHTRHLAADPRCAIMVLGAAETANPQTAPRLTVTGQAELLDDPAMRRFWVDRHPYAALYADFSDFAVWRLVPQAGHFVGGFARAAVLGPDALRCPDTAVAALRQAQAGIVAHCNADHPDALNLAARSQGRSGDWRMLGVDPDGFDLVQDETVLRVAFGAPVEDAAGVRGALVRAVEEGSKNVLF